MIVLGIAIIEFVNGSAIKLETLEQARIDEFSKRSIDRRGTDIVRLATTGQSIDQLVSIEMIMLAKNGVNQKLSLTGLTQSACL